MITIEGWAFRQEAGGWRAAHPDGRRTGLHLSLRAARWGAGLRPADEPLDILTIGLPEGLGSDDKEQDDG